MISIMQLKKIIPGIIFLCCLGIQSSFSQDLQAVENNLLINRITIESNDPTAVSRKPELLQAVIRSLLHKYDMWINYNTDQPADYTVNINIKQIDEWIKINTVCTYQMEQLTNSSNSVVPAKSVFLIPDLISNDIFYLWAALTAPVFNLVQAPFITAVLELVSMQEISLLADCFGTAPLLNAVTQTDEQILLSTSAYHLHLDSSLRITTNTMQDLFIQSQHNLTPDIRAVAPNPLDDIKIFYYNEKLTIIDSGLRLSLYEAGMPISFTRLLSLPDGLLISLENGGLYTLKRSGQTLQQTPFPAGPGFITALGSNQDIWVFDLQSRSIRVLTQRGEWLKTIKPVLSSREIQFPEILQPYADQSFILGGNGKLWKFDSRGIPIWQLDTLPLNHPEALPAQFRLAASTGSTAFFLGDTQQQRIIRFQEDLSSQELQAADLLKQLKPNSKKNLLALIKHYQSSSQLLLALQYCNQLEELEPGLEEQELIALVRRSFEKTQVDHLALAAKDLHNRLLWEEAESFYKYTLEQYRNLWDKYPVERDLPIIIEEINNTRRNIRKIIHAPIVFELSIPATGKNENLIYQNDRSNTCQLILTHNSSDTLTNIKIDLVLDFFYLQPAHHFIQSFPPGTKQAIDCQYQLKASQLQLQDETYKDLCLLLTFTQAGVEKQNYLRYSIHLQPGSN